MYALSAMTPWYARWAVNRVAPMLLGFIADLAVRALNFMTDGRFRDCKLTELQVCELAATLDAPLKVIAEVYREQPLGDCIEALYQDYGICPTPDPVGGEIAMPETYNRGVQLSPNLARWEIACRCGCGFDTITPATVTLFQAIRDYIGRPIRINSGCRCPERNEAVGGAPESYHMQGEALDMQVNGLSSRQLGALIREAHALCPIVAKHLRFVYLMGNAVHIDTGRARRAVFPW